MSWYKRILFLMVVGGITYGLHFYVWTLLPLHIKSTSTYYFPLCGTILTCSYFVVGSVLSTSTWRWLAWLSGMWMGAMFFLLIFLGSLHLVTFFCDITQIEIAYEPISLLLVIWSLLLLVYGLKQAAKKPLVKHVKLTLPQLDPRLEGLRIVQLTDIHIGPTLGKKFSSRYNFPPTINRRSKIVIFSYFSIVSR